MAEVPRPLAQTVFSALNHVLRQQQWARDRLRAHVGRTVRLVIESPLGAMSTDAAITGEGLLVVAGDGDPAVTLTMRPSIDAFFGALRSGPRGLGPHLKVEGDVMAAGAIGEIAQNLQWDFEEDLSRVVGDVAAFRIGEGLRGAARRGEDMRERFESALRHYLVDEGRQLVSRERMTSFAVDVRELERSVERLERRVAGTAR